MYRFKGSDVCEFLSFRPRSYSQQDVVSIVPQENIFLTALKHVYCANLVKLQLHLEKWHVISVKMGNFPTAAEQSVSRVQHENGDRLMEFLAQIVALHQSAPVRLADAQIT